MKLIKNIEYESFLHDVKSQIVASQHKALQSVNKQLVELYWYIGQSIVEKQKQNGWGDSVIMGLAQDLQIAFPGIKGFSARNLWKMRDLYVSYVDFEKLPPLVAEISWTNNLLILEKCSEMIEREFYLRMAKKYGWSKTVLANHIENQSYEKTILSQHNFDVAVPVELKIHNQLLLKDEYTFDFLELGNDYSERQLENAISIRIDAFLQEMGGVFAFMGRQFRVEVSGKEYFIDLLLYHRNLKCLVAIELKIDEFIPEYMGKMQFYLRALDTTMKRPDENPSIGIILCRTKDRATVEYALYDAHKPIGVASYTIMKKLPKELSDELPSLEQIRKLIDEI